MAPAGEQASEPEPEPAGLTPSLEFLTHRRARVAAAAPEPAPEEAAAPEPDPVQVLPSFQMDAIKTFEKAAAKSPGVEGRLDTRGEDYETGKSVEINEWPHLELCTGVLKDPEKEGFRDLEGEKYVAWSLTNLHIAYINVVGKRHQWKRVTQLSLERWARAADASAPVAGADQLDKSTVGGAEAPQEPKLQLTYAQFGERIGRSPDAVRTLVARRRLPRTIGSDGKALVTISQGILDQLQSDQSPGGDPTTQSHGGDHPITPRSSADHHPIISRSSGDDRELAAANTAGTDALPSGGGGTTRKEKDERATTGAATGDPSEATLALSESEHKAAKALQGKRSRGRPPPGTGMAWRA